MMLKFPSNKTIIIAHRGVKSRYPENTLEAFGDALLLGVDAIECDLQETQDQNFIIFHDDLIDGRLIPDTNLKSIASKKLMGNFRIPTLEETLEVCHDRVGLILEIKKMKSFERFSEIIGKYQSYNNQLAIVSFEIEVLVKLSRMLQVIPFGLIINGKLSKTVFRLICNKFKYIGIRSSYLDSVVMQQARNANIKVFAWDVSDIEIVMKLMELGVDGIVCDNPDQVLKQWPQLRMSPNNKAGNYPK